MAFLSMGFRPFFLIAALWAALSMALWIGFWAGAVVDLGPLDPLDWHMHEMLFGYGGAVLCGFLLTAAPNWTGRAPLAGAPLAALAALWLLGRVVVLGWLGLSPLLVMAVDLSFPLAFCAVTARELLAAGNRRNLPVLALCVLFMLANAAFHLEAARMGSALGGYGGRLGLAVLVLLISLIGGRIIPAFTRNWLKARGATALPAAMGRFDAAVLAASGVALLLWVAAPSWPGTGAVMIFAALGHAARQARWCEWPTRVEPLLFGLHQGYRFVALGFALGGLAALAPALVPQSAAIHSWTAGAIGLMTLTVMSRAALGHSGRALKAGWVETAYLGGLWLAAVLRILAAWPAMPGEVLHLSAGLWCAGFLAFALRFLPVMLTPRLVSPTRP